MPCLQSRSEQPDHGQEREWREATASRSWLGLWFGSGLLWVLVGCQGPSHELSTDYGRQDPSRRGISIHGTDIFARLLLSQGASVSTTRRLGYSARTADAILWFPSDFRRPSPKVRDFLSNWLQEDARRRLLVVGPYYDAESRYWDFVASTASRDQRALARWEAARAAVAELLRYSKAPRKLDYGWFQWTVLDVEYRSRLRGPWAGGRMARHAIWSGRSQVETARDAPGGTGTGAAATTTLLETETAQALVVEVRPSTAHGRIVAIADGSFLFNFALADPRNHPLAEALADYLLDSKRVVFLEAGGQPRLVDPAVPHPFLQAFNTPPLRSLLLHALFAGILIGFAAFPLFGRPCRAPQTSGVEFGDHVRALGELLSQTRKEQYAQQLLDQFRHVSCGTYPAAADSESAQSRLARPARARVRQSVKKNRPANLVGKAGGKRN